MTLDYYRHHFSQLHTAANHIYWGPETLYKAPNKPLLLLAVLDLFAQGRIEGDLIELTSELEDQFASYWAQVMPSLRNGNIAMPFFHLRTDGFWHLIPRPGQEGTLATLATMTYVSQARSVLVGAQLDKDLVTLLRATESRESLRRVLVESYFATETQAQLTEQGIGCQEAYRHSQELLVQEATQVLKETDEPYRTVDSEQNFLSKLESDIAELELSRRAYNCLRRTRINTVGQVLAILPKGPRLIRQAGIQTWTEIESAVTNYLAQNEVAPRDIESETTQASLVDSAGHDIEIRIDVLELPSDVVTALHTHDICTCLQLANSTLYGLTKIGELVSLSYEDWFRLIPIIKGSGHPRDIQLAGTAARPKSSLLALELSARPLNSLARAGILDWETLASLTLAELVNIRNFGAKSLAELFAKTRTALDSGGVLAEDALLRIELPAIQTDIAPEQSGNTFTTPMGSIIVGAPEPQTLDDRFEVWFAPLNERQREVLKWRYGLADGQPNRLEEIGKRLNLTRERVRQIEARSLGRLLQQVPVRELTIALWKRIIEEGGIIGEAELSDMLSELIEVVHIHPLGAIRLLLATSPGFTRVKGTQIWCLSELSELVPLVDREAVSILNQALAPISTDEFLRRFRLTQFCKDSREALDDRFILACARNSEKIVQRDDGSFALESWERHWQDDIVVALRRLGQPMHYADIADAINASQPSDRQVTARAVHIRLMQRPDVFVWVGLRGTYGLKEWGTERALTYIDALTQVLQDARHPLTITEILAALVKLRPYYDETSVQLTLGTNDQFRAFPGNTFGLAEWREEDFASESYRVQRLFEISEAVSVRGAKPQVLDAINGVDGFIARIRENGDYAR